MENKNRGLEEKLEAERLAELWTPSVQELAWRIVWEGGDAVIVADRKGLIRFWNPRAEEMFGYSAGEAIGQSLDLIVPDKHRHRHWEGYRRVMETRETKYGRGKLLSVPALRKDGSRISVEFTIAMLKDDHGGVQGIAAIMRDVTERWQQEKALGDQLAELRARLAQIS